MGIYPSDKIAGWIKNLGTESDHQPTALIDIQKNIEADNASDTGGSVQQSAFDMLLSEIKKRFEKDPAKGMPFSKIVEIV